MGYEFALDSIPGKFLQGVVSLVKSARDGTQSCFDYCHKITEKLRGYPLGEADSVGNVIVGERRIVEPSPIPGNTTAEKLAAIDRTRVWYWSYGSNMDPERLDAYLFGRRPPGSAPTAKVHKGVSDESKLYDENNQPIDKSRRPAFAMNVPGHIVFDDISNTWGGGMGHFVPPTEDIPLDRTWPEGESFAAGHAHLLLTEHFNDLVDMENDRRRGQFSLTQQDWEQLVDTGKVVKETDNLYGTVRLLGMHEGHPIVTFTHDKPPSEIVLHPPADLYLKRLTTGLRLSHGWNAQQIRDYFLTCPGIQNTHWEFGTRLSEVVSSVFLDEPPSGVQEIVDPEWT